MKMPFDDIPEDETPPLAIQTIEQARLATQCVLDWADFNLTECDAAEVPTETAQNIYDAAKSLAAALACST